MGNPQAQAYARPLSLNCAPGISLRMEPSAGYGSPKKQPSEKGIVELSVRLATPA